ncbi:MAG: aspartate-semialdehyde dehydrogenase [Bacteroidia bacterium]|nr:aspartate-semialdehyde dehydrogenase [Bacteroidia bacterium]
MKVAVVGATGLVGGVMLKVLEERHFPVSEIIPVASSASIGKELVFNGRTVTVTGLAEAVALKPGIALFSAGAAISRQWAPVFAEAGTTVIDNSSAWRMDGHIRLIVPEVNAHLLQAGDKIIANPNCSAIPLVIVICPLHKRFGIKRVVVSTYQSVTGSGMKAVRQLMEERQGIAGDKAYPHPVDMNCFPHGGNFLPDGNTTEEIKLINETRKILNEPGLKITATVVRIPVTGGHSESVNIEFVNSFDLEEVREIISQTKGVIVQDDPANNIYPMPLYAGGKDEVFAGRIRRDESVPNGLNLWIVTDNLRKGAATNAVQIAEYLVRKGFI